MNRVIARAKAMVLLIVLLAGGTLFFLGEHMLDTGEGFALCGGTDLRNGGAVKILHSSAGDDQPTADIEIINGIPDKRQFQRTGKLTMR